MGGDVYLCLCLYVHVYGHRLVCMLTQVRKSYTLASTREAASSGMKAARQPIMNARCPELNHQVDLSGTNQQDTEEGT